MHINSVDEIMKKIDTRSMYDKMIHRSSIEDDTANELLASGDWIELHTDYGTLLHHKVSCTLWWDNDGTPADHFVLSVKTNTYKIEVKLPFGKEAGFYAQHADRILSMLELTEKADMK